MRLLSAAIVAALVASGPVRADAPAGQPVVAPPSVAAPVAVAPDIVITSTPERSTKNIEMLSAIAGSAVVLGGIGLYFHLDARDASDMVGAKTFTNQPWTSAQQALVDRAHSSSTKAEVFYALGGAALIGAIVELILTAPEEERTVIHPHATPTVAPAPGGAVVGGTWRF